MQYTASIEKLLTSSPRREGGTATGDNNHPCKESIKFAVAREAGLCLSELCCIQHAATSICSGINCRNWLSGQRQLCLISLVMQAWKHRSFPEKSIKNFALKPRAGTLRGTVQDETICMDSAHRKVHHCQQIYRSADLQIPGPRCHDLL